MAVEILRHNSSLSRGRGSFLLRVCGGARQELRGRIIDTLSRTPLGSLIGLGGPALALVYRYQDQGRTVTLRPDQTLDLRRIEPPIPLTINSQHPTLEFGTQYYPRF